jgi:hypothetical protein
MSDAKDRAARAAIKNDRTRDASRAMQEYEAKRRAALDKTARLRALRLAHEAGSVAVAKAIKAPSAKTQVEKH